MFIDQIELQLYRYHRKQSPVAQALPEIVQYISGFNVKGSAILIAHGQQQLRNMVGIGSGGNQRALDGRTDVVRLAQRPA